MNSQSSQFYGTHADFAHFEYAGQFWTINSKGSGCCPKMLRTLFEQVFSFQVLHRRTFALRIDLRQPDTPDNNQRMTVFLRRLTKALKAHYQIKHLGYFWARERHQVANPHYHLLLLLDGKQVHYAPTVIEFCQTHWENLSGSVYVPANCYYQLTRGDEETLRRLLYRASYLAKHRGKDQRLSQTKRYGASRRCFSR